MGLLLLRPPNHLHAQHLPPLRLLQVVKLVYVIIELAVQIYLLGMLT